MDNQTKDWQVALQSWLQKHPKTMPDDLWQLREDFVRHFPIDSLTNMTLDQYALGKQKESFCYWLEFKTKELGEIRGGSAAKFGVWWSKSEERWRWNSVYQSAEDALTHIKQGLIALIDATRAEQFGELDKIGRELLGPNRYSLRGKPLYLYFPEYFLPISNPEHLKHFLRQFGEQPEGDLIALNHQLLSFLQSLPPFNGFDTRQMMIFLYEQMPPRKGDVVFPTEPQKPEELDLPIFPLNVRTKVFISYSHENEEELNRLLVHLKAAKLNKMVEWWDDTQIRPGEDRNKEIQKAIDLARVAVLLVSVDYLASDSIVKNELLPLLTASEEEGITILPVIVGPCGFEYTDLARLQAVNDLSTPLSKMSKHEKDEVWNKVVRTIWNPDNF